jgi:hypothetical protein
MPDEQLTVAARRLKADLHDLKLSLRRTYDSPTQQVTSADLRNTATTLAEIWIADLSQRPEILAACSAKYLADLDVHFQRLLTFAERATIRRRYEEEIKAILKRYTEDLVVPLMQNAGRVRPADPGGNENGDGPAPKAPKPPARADAEGFQPTAFIGHSFAPEDEAIVEAVTNVLKAIGVDVVTGKKPKAERISDKVKGLIDAQHMFVGIFTRRDKLEGKKKWSTSTWVIDEKAYASRTKKLILLKEDVVDSIGGIQGDYEFIEFTRGDLGKAVISLLEIFKLRADGLQ